MINLLTPLSDESLNSPYKVTADSLYGNKNNDHQPKKLLIV